MNKTKLIVFLYSLLLSFTGITQSLSFTDKLKKYETILKSTQEEQHIPSVSFIILKNQEIVYSNAFGYADVKKKITATDTTLYSIASLTKPIAATLIMKQYEEGKLDIEAPIKNYWPGYMSYFTNQKKMFSRYYRRYLPYIENYNFEQYPITMRHHLSHTSEGIPGTHFKYNGLLYGRLAKIIDVLFPQHFTGLMDSCIFKKLNLEYSFLNYEVLKSSSRSGNLALPYVYNENKNSFRQMDFPDPPDLNAGAGLLCSVKDLAKFDIAFDKNEIISSKIKELMVTPGKTINGELFPYGIGWFVTKHHKDSVIYHYGLQETYSGFYLKLPEKNITLIVLANSSALTEKYNTNIQTADLDNIPYVKLFLDLFERDN
jgi:CubicO group peptidase (beta-lactamase class C family)